ncbi:MAG: hypothetical protein EBZ69_10010, partial [Alphaproteobacteria bacterium]|nr:hypothetical protein [Alphaproteobacteria bacterium]
MAPVFMMMCCFQDDIYGIVMTKNFEIFRPENSVWVEASAGSGKTFFLVSRLLALLL